MTDLGNLHLFLLAGQSNMAGRGGVEPRDREPHPRVLALSRNGEWQPAIDPIHFDKPCAGVGPGRAFARVLAEANESVTVGLIPCAAGGSPISTWQPGGYWEQTRSRPYEDAVARVRRATEDGVLKAVLWHQGESDATPELAEGYAASLRELIARLREDLGDRCLPFVIGQLGRFDGKPWSPEREEVNRAHIAVAEEDPAAVFVSSEGLTSIGDRVHFDAASQREFGRRYAAAYQRLAGSAGPKRPEPGPGPGQRDGNTGG